MKKQLYLFGILVCGGLSKLPAQQSVGEQSYFGTVKVSNLEGLNTNELEMCPVPFQDGLIFTSSRRSEDSDLKGGRPGKKYTDLYFSQVTEKGSYITPVLIPGLVNGRLHDGMACFSNDAQTMYFTRNNKSGRAGDGLVDLKICSAQWINGEWGNIKDLAFNGKKHSNCHPTLNADNTKMYFASNRAGGFGGMDIYVSEWQNGEWQEPMNIGVGMNTSGNEIFPFHGDGGNLFFSSDGHGGQGGLDIFLALGPDGGDWGRVENLGKPFSSPSDDFGFYTNKLGTFGYFSSSRAGGEGRDDIYQWEVEKEVALAAVKQLVSKDLDEWEDSFVLEDIAYQNPLNPNDLQELDLLTGKLELMDQLIHELKTERQAAGNGDSRLLLDSKILDALIEKHEVAMNLHTKTLSALSKKQKAASKTDKKLLKQSKTLEDLIKKHEIAMASHAKVLKELMEEQRQVMAKDSELMTTSYGLDERIKKHEVLMADHTYTLASLLMGKEIRDTHKPRRVKEEEEFFSLEAQMNQWEKERIAENERPSNREPMLLSDYMASMATVPTSVSVTVPVTIINPENRIRKEIVYSAPDTKTEVYPTERRNDIPANPVIGQVIRMDKIYYDFDQAKLKPASIVELDKVVNFLFENPGMQITIMAHTDSRGEANYNFELSQMRAESVLTYLVSRNISRARLKARGYGENMPINQCYNGVDCSDEDHALNRRTEFKIDQLNGK